MRPMLNDEQKSALTLVLDGLMRRYKQRVPDVSTIIAAMIEKGLINQDSDIINDHIAFRTMGVPNLGIASLEKIFLAYGYEKRDYYYFEQKKLDAYWYSPPSDIPNLPRVFISECRVGEFSKAVQDIIYKYTNQITSDPLNYIDLLDGHIVDKFLHSGLWPVPTWEEFQTVLAESEYASWVLFNRYYLNHFTITVQALPDGYNSIATFNDFLKSIGISLNSAGGEIKTSQDGKLIQSSSVSKEIVAQFPHNDGSVRPHRLSGSYVEFAQRLENRDGFDSVNADKIFESTYTDQVNK